MERSTVAIDTFDAVGNVNIRNEGIIKQNVVMGAGNDSFSNEKGKTGVTASQTKMSK